MYALHFTSYKTSSQVEAVTGQEMMSREHRRPKVTGSDVIGPDVIWKWQ